MASVRYLRQAGYDIKSIGTDYSGVRDEVVMGIAIQEERTILTFDRDYGELIFRKNLRPEDGVIYLRLLTFTPEFPGRLIADLLQKKRINIKRRLTVIDLDGIRQRKY